MIRCVCPTCRLTELTKHCSRCRGHGTVEWDMQVDEELKEAQELHEELREEERLERVAFIAGQICAGEFVDRSSFRAHLAVATAAQIVRAIDEAIQLGAADRE